MYLNLNVLVSHFEYIQYYYMRTTSQLKSCNLAIIVRCRRVFIIDSGTLNTLLLFIIIMFVFSNRHVPVCLRIHHNSISKHIQWIQSPNAPTGERKCP